MPDAARIFVLISAVWAVVALAVQVLSAWGGGRHDFSRRVGSPVRGIAYSFTVAMAPSYKESIRLHPFEFGVGLLMHIGVVVALMGLVLLCARPTLGATILAVTRPLAITSLLAGLFLFIRRLRSPNLRGMSVPDDYLAVLATCGLLACAALPVSNPAGRTTFLICAGLLLVYLPLGKLRHAVFFFVARGDYGRRLGYRGVYPPSSASAE